MDVFGKSINKHNNCIKASLGLRKTNDEVSRGAVPWTFRNVQRLLHSSRFGG